jgi:hypothetical protein
MEKRRTLRANELRATVPLDLQKAFKINTSINGRRFGAAGWQLAPVIKPLGRFQVNKFNLGFDESAKIGTNINSVHWRFHNSGIVSGAFKGF